ncbi:response regulator transcription factor [Pedobacter sp. BMA]|uniref:response regulator transcription factor n=1 Tax=Pedobacter sp. BMA TaxID=1663685 RepID=UPI00064A0DF3|nr:helix-turn-helix transcriptional regulator [Pedobacter sp. BMA]KLT66267.1 hypothetical protein AB669_09010 [Pedobacter sp. BMA]
MRNLLDIKLFSQPFESDHNQETQLDNGKLIAGMYARMENSISVLSDMKARKSYIYYAPVADELGLLKRETEINSIWEDELLNKIHPDDLLKKYRLEFQFFQMLNMMPVDERVNFELITRLRIKNKNEQYIALKHRLLYIGNAIDGSIWLALCLYNLIPDHPDFVIPQGMILNTKTGDIIDQHENRFNTILSAREKEIMQLISIGKRSKEIAKKLDLSINTINRHRQNIFAKLNVTSVIEACRIAANTEII